jgi:hypothetical protein
MGTKTFSNLTLQKKRISSRMPKQAKLGVGVSGTTIDMTSCYGQ